MNGLGILDLYTENPGESTKRLIGNLVVSADLVGLVRPTYEVDVSKTLVGFENHGGRTYLGKTIKPLGQVIKGFGNNGKDKSEGAIYKNSFGSYLHGPILPKNPRFADLLITKALEKKYGDIPTKLPPLDDSLEIKAHDAIAERLNIKL